MRRSLAGLSAVFMVLSTSCGLAQDRRQDQAARPAELPTSTTTVDRADARDRSRPPLTDDLLQRGVTEESDSAKGVVDPVDENEDTSDAEGSASTPGDAPRSGGNSSSITGVLTTKEQVSGTRGDERAAGSEADAQLIKDCTRIQRIQKTGEALLYAAYEKRDVAGPLSEVADAFAAVVGMAPPDTQPIVRNLVSDMRRGVEYVRNEQDYAKVLALLNSGLADRARSITELLTSLRPTCPDLLKDNLADAEHVVLGREIGG